MKKITGLLLVAFLSSIAVNAQDSTWQKQRSKNDTSWHNQPGDTSKRKNWNNDYKQKHKDKKNWPDSGGNRMDTSTRRKDYQQ